MRLYLLSYRSRLPNELFGNALMGDKLTYLLNQPYTNLRYNQNTYNNIYAGHYSSIFNIDELDVFPSIGKPGPWVFNLELPENVNLLETDKRVPQSGYLSADAGFFFPASVFDLSRKQVIINRNTDRQMGSFNFKATSSQKGVQPAVSRASASIVDPLINEYSNLDSNVWVSTQASEENNNILKSSNLRILKDTTTSSKFSRLLNFASSGKTNKGFSHMISWRKRKLLNSSNYGKKLKFTKVDKLKNATPSYQLTNWLPKELQIPLMSLEPINLPLPFYQTVVRWKPSGSTWWRLYRRIFSYQLSKATTQHREQLTQRAITRWVARCWRVLSFSSLKFWASTVASVLERAGWENSPNWIINQRAIENRLWQVYPGDIIQIRGLPGSRRMIEVSPISKLEPSRRALWVHWAPALEIDELTYSVVIIHWGQSTSVRTTTFPYLTHRLYNWKYRT